MEVGRFEEAITAHQDVAAIYREIGDEYGEGRALNNIETVRSASAMSRAARSGSVAASALTSIRPSNGSGTFWAHHLAICPELMRTAEISTADQAAWLYVRPSQRDACTGPGLQADSPPSYGLDLRRSITRGSGRVAASR